MALIGGALGGVLEVSKLSGLSPRYSLGGAPVSLCQRLLPSPVSETGHKQLAAQVNCARHRRSAYELEL